MLFAGIFVLAFAASSGSGRLLDSLTPSANANPGKHNQCNLSSIEGGYGLSFQGDTSDEGPGVGVASEVCDGNGHCSGHATYHVGSFVINDTYTSQYTVNPDCSGSRTITYASGLIVHLAFVVTADDVIPFIGTDTDVLLSGTARGK
jgi:hypothetical protein